jgi:hypothetical protein
MTGKLKPSPYELRNVRLQTCGMKTNSDFDPLRPGLELQPQFRILPCKVTHSENTWQHDGSKFYTGRYLLCFEFRYVEKQKLENASDEDFFAEITAEFAVDYLQLEPDVLTESEQQSWANGNAMLHAWPYWRELCQNALARMSLPIVVMPILSSGLIDAIAKDQQPEASSSD